MAGPLVPFHLGLRRNLACAACCVAALAGAGRAAVPPGNAPELVETWGMDKGLPQTSVTAVIQTRDGYLWAGTDGGLARFDGMKFTTFRTTNTPGLTNHAVTQLFEDRAGQLWIGTESGLIRYRTPTFATAGLEGRTIVALSEDPAGTLWIGTNDGVYRHDGAQIARVTALHHELRGRVETLFADSAGRVWLSFADGGGLLRREGDHVEGVVEVGGQVLAMAEQPHGTMWFGTTNGLVRWRDGVFERYGTDHGLAVRWVGDLHADRAGNLWIASASLHRITTATSERCTRCGRWARGRFRASAWIATAMSGRARRARGSSRCAPRNFRWSSSARAETSRPASAL